jgi:hypothetical protein
MAQALQLPEGDHAYRAVLYRESIAVVFVRENTIESKRLTCHVKARDLLIAVAMHDDSLEAAGSHGV